jgi:hypothetical protein
MNAFEAQKNVKTGIVQLMKPDGYIFRFIILNSQVQALTLNNVVLEDGDERGPSLDDLNNTRWEIYHACQLNTKQGEPLWFNGFRMS